MSGCTRASPDHRGRPLLESKHECVIVHKTFPLKKTHAWIYRDENPTHTSEYSSDSEYSFKIAIIHFTCRLPLLLWCILGNDVIGCLSLWSHCCAIESTPAVKGASTWKQTQVTFLRLSHLWWTFKRRTLVAVNICCWLPNFAPIIIQTVSHSCLEDLLLHLKEMPIMARILSSITAEVDFLSSGFCTTLQK